jgi:hypothetical protein
MKVYEGRVVRGEPFVWILDDGAPRLLPGRQDLLFLAPMFCWGEASPAAAQLALALVADALGSDRDALAIHQEYKARIVAGLAPWQPWQLTQKDIIAVCETILQGRVEALQKEERSHWQGRGSRKRDEKSTWCARKGVRRV